MVKHMYNVAEAYRKFCLVHFPLPSETQVRNLERKLGVNLPADYRRFLLEFNGGFFSEPRITPTSADCPLDRLTVMAGINPKEPSADLGAPGVFNPATFDDNDPPVLLPIGYTMMGNLIFMVVEAGADDTAQFP